MRVKNIEKNLHISNRVCRFGVTVALSNLKANFYQNNNTFGHAGASPVFLRLLDAAVSDSNVLFTNSLRMTAAKEKVHSLLQGGGECFTHTVNTPRKLPGGGTTKNPKNNLHFSNKRCMFGVLHQSEKSDFKFHITPEHADVSSASFRYSDWCSSDSGYYYNTFFKKCYTKKERRLPHKVWENSANKNNTLLHIQKVGRLPVSLITFN